MCGWDSGSLTVIFSYIPEMSKLLWTLHRREVCGDDTEIVFTLKHNDFVTHIITIVF